MSAFHCYGGLTVREKYGSRIRHSPYPERQWPSKTLDKAPVFLSCDLRDGNQSLANPMTFQMKLRMFRLLVDIGFREIEIGFPCANQSEFDFARYLVDTPGIVPDNVIIQVLTPCREDAIQTTVDSVRGAKRACIFLYLPSSDNYRITNLNISEDEWVERARRCTAYTRSITKDDPATCATDWKFGFGFEDFGSARVEAVVRCADVVTAQWGPTTTNPIIIGVASSVEVTTPNVFADRVEQVSRALAKREEIRLSIHPHNDRGTAVASAELGCLAGAERVEGCLFGNGERAGNLDLVVFTFNLFASGIDPGVDFSKLDHICSVYKEVTDLSIHPRAPYAGEYYFKAFSGGHQDGICKGLALRAAGSASKESNDFWPVWRVPYLPIDPADVGRSMRDVMGVTSQSGKAGVAWAIRTGFGLELPIELARSFSQKIKQLSITSDHEFTIEETCNHFLEEYAIFEAIQATDNGKGLTKFSRPNATTAGTTNIDTISTHSINAGVALWRVYQRGTNNNVATATIPPSTGLVAAYVRVNESDGAGERWGVGIGISKREAELCAAISAARAIPAYQT